MTSRVVSPAVHRLPDAPANTSYLVEVSDGQAIVIDPPRDVDAHLALASRLALVTVCGDGERSATAASLLEARGLRVANLTGGTTGWLDAGLPVER